MSVSREVGATSAATLGHVECLARVAQHLSDTPGDIARLIVHFVAILSMGHEFTCPSRRGLREGSTARIRIEESGKRLGAGMRAHIACTPGTPLRVGVPTFPLYACPLTSSSLAPTQPNKPTSRQAREGPSPQHHPKSLAAPLRTPHASILFPANYLELPLAVTPTPMTRSHLLTTLTHRAHPGA